MTSQPESRTIRADEIFIDQQVMIDAGLDESEREDWTCFAQGMLDRATRLGRWDLGYPVVSDRASHRGPNGERYVLLAFRNEEPA